MDSAAVSEANRANASPVEAPLRVGSLPTRSCQPGRNGHRLTVRLGTATDRDIIYRLRHEVYARELRQHTANEVGRLSDALDAFNLYLVIAEGEAVVGFVSITPPGSPSFSIDKYLRRDQLPFPFDDRLYEGRLLTVPETNRRSLLALALMYAAFAGWNPTAARESWRLVGARSSACTNAWGSNPLASPCNPAPSRTT